MAATSCYTSQQWKTIIVIASVHFASAICISIQAPFYPEEAESKGGTATEYGLVFGIFELTAFLSCPIFGKFLNQIGAKLALNVGVVVAAICSILFGLLDYVPTHDAFISLSFVVRVVESLGASAALTAAFAITADAFPQSVATTFATLEVFYGVGYIAGPTIGGLLYTLDGYMLPFSVMGGTLFLVGGLIYFLLPELSKQQNCDEDDGKPAPGILNMLSVPAVLVDSLCIMSASSSMGFYAATLEPHLRQFDLSPLAMSSMFVLSGAFYAASAPIIGRLCDRGVSPRLLTLGGCVLVLIGALLVGPAPFIPQLQTTLGLCIAGLTIHGVGIAMLLVSCFIDALRSAIGDAGFKDGLATYGLVSGLWASSFSLGAFVGPSMAGVLFDLVGFRGATYFVLGTQLLVFSVVLVFLMWTKHNKKYKRTNLEVVEEQGEGAPLLPTGLKRLSNLEPKAWVPSCNEYGATTDPCRAQISAREMHPLKVFG